MKNNKMKKGMFGLLAVSALLLGGCAQGQGKLSYIGADAAKKQILAEVGLEESQVKINSVDMATRNGMDYYQVEFSDDNGNTYRYDIDALTGKVIESAAAGDTSGGTAETAAAADANAETTAQTAAGGNAETTTQAVAGGNAETTTQAAAGGNAKTTAQAAADVNAETTAQAAADRAAESTAAAVRIAAAEQTPAVQTAAEQTPAGTMLTEEEAKEKALSHAQTVGTVSVPITFVKAKLEWDDGKQIYDVEFYGSDRTEYEYEIDAYSGDVLSADIDIKPKTLQSGTASAGGGTNGNGTAGTQAAQQPVQQPAANSGSGYTILAEESAKQLALAQVPGAALSDIVEFETDRDDGRIEYEGTIYYGGMEYEFEIDAYSGAFRKWECEYDDDHHDDGHH